MLFQSSKLKARTSLFTETRQKRRWSFEFSKMKPQVGLAVPQLPTLARNCLQNLDHGGMGEGGGEMGSDLPFKWLTRSEPLACSYRGQYIGCRLSH